MNIMSQLTRAEIVDQYLASSYQVVSNMNEHHRNLVMILSTKAQ